MVVLPRLKETTVTAKTMEEQILERYAAGERDFRNLDLDDRTYDFSGANLAHARFSGSFIVADFANATLTGADFSRCNVKTCNFSGADLRQASFHSSAICAAVFDKAELDGTDFEDASWHSHRFKKGELPI